MFDEKYYDDLWGGVHRHDYAQSFADALVLKYGKVKYLDVGAGCGYLVKVLNEMGCDAYGIEISDYAIDNSCAPDRIISGSITDIPFEDNEFDVVFTSGVLEYVPEEEVILAVQECKRVASEQLHNLDCSDESSEETIISQKWVTIKPRAWWNEMIK